MLPIAGVCCRLRTSRRPLADVTRRPNARLATAGAGEGSGDRRMKAPGRLIGPARRLLHITRTARASKSPLCRRRAAWCCPWRAAPWSKASQPRPRCRSRGTSAPYERSCRAGLGSGWCGTSHVLPCQAPARCGLTAGEGLTPTPGTQALMSVSKRRASSRRHMKLNTNKEA